MSRIGWVTCEKMRPYSPRELPVVERLEKEGHEIVSVVWNLSEVDLKTLDWIIIRSPWDYYFHISEFKKWIEHLPEGRVFNSKKVLLWNLDKVYLQELFSQGVAIVPTHFHFVTENSDLSVEARKINSSEVVIKPSQSASSYLTQIVKQGARIESKEYLGKTVLIQPKIQEVLTEGEFSQIFIAGIYSHTVLKKPKAGDFRVQQSFGGSVERVHPSASEIDFGKSVIEKIPEATLYARVDYVRLAGKPHLMELEVLEPDLFFDQSPESIGFFSDAIQHIESITKNTV